MTSTPAPPTLRYRETHSGLTWQLITLGVLLPGAAAIAGIVLGVSVDPEWFMLTGFLPITAPVLITSALLYRNWPTGILLDDTGITTGAIGSARASTRHPTVSHQSWGLFSAPWDAILDINVVIDPQRLRSLGRAPDYTTLNNRWGMKPGTTHCMIGVLSSPFMRAALVVEVDLTRAQFPKTRTAYFYNNFGTPFRNAMPPKPSWTWVIPTRHPDQLRRLITQHNDSSTKPTPG